MRAPSSDPAAAVRQAAAQQRQRWLRLVRRSVRTRSDAEDILQTAMERALEHCAEVRDPARAEAWIARIVRNTLIDELRKRVPETLTVSDVAMPAEDEPSCWCVLAQAERLKPEYAEILKLAAAGDRSTAEIAHLLGLTPNNATVRLHRAKKALRQQMLTHCGTSRARSCTECGCEERGCCEQP